MQANELFTQPNTILLDGGMGTMLQAAGLKLGAKPEELNITDPALIEGIHAKYAAAGSRIINANTFGASAHKLAGSAYTLEEIIAAGIANCKRACAPYGALAALDVGPLVKLLPSSMQPVMVARWGIDPATRANQITREQKRELVQLMKHWRVSIDARGDLAHAVITSGGVSVREVDPKTMQSKKALGLYFAGEVLDVDAYTGGYNLQIAFCTAQSFANHLE